MARNDGQVLLAREMGLLAGPEYLEQIIDHQWTMARAAKAGETGYDELELLPQDEDVFRAGPARLTFTGYAKKEKRIDYSCYLAEGQHIAGWEIVALRDILNSQRTPDWKVPVKVARIVFAQKWMATSGGRCSISAAK